VASVSPQPRFKPARVILKQERIFKLFGELLQN